MKIRTGFVSNSSSSSFIIGVKPGVELTTDKLLELFKVPKDSPVYGLNKEIAQCLINCAELVDAEYLAHDYGYDTIEDAINNGAFDEKTREMLQRNDIVMYRGWVSNEDGGIEAGLCDTAFNIVTEDFILQKSAGY